MAEQTETAITLPITPGKIQSAVGYIVEQTFPRPRQELCIPVGEMERRLSALVGETVQAAYNDAAEIHRDARERLARHLYLEGSPANWRGTAELGWDRQDDRINRDAWLARADAILAIIIGKDT